jgi:hypothetical protein
MRQGNRASEGSHPSDKREGSVLNFSENRQRVRPAVGGSLKKLPSSSVQLGAELAAPHDVPSLRSLKCA